MAEQSNSLTLDDVFEIGRVADPNSAENKNFGAYMTAIFQKLKNVEPKVFDSIKNPRFLLSDNEMPDANVFLGASPPVFTFSKGMFDIVTTQDEMAAVLAHAVAGTALTGGIDIFALNTLEKAGYNKRAGISVFEKVNPFKEIENQNPHSFFKLFGKDKEELDALSALLETPEFAPSLKNRQQISPIKPLLRAVWMKSDNHISFIDQMKKNNNYKNMTGEQQMAFWNSMMKSYDFTKTEALRLSAKELHRMQEVRKAYEKYVKAVDLPAEHRYVIKDKLIENAQKNAATQQNITKKEIKKEVELTEEEKKKELLAKKKEALKRDKAEKKAAKKKYNIDGEEIELLRRGKNKGGEITVTAGDLFNDLPSKDPRVKAIAKAIYIDEMSRALNGKAITPDTVPPNFKITFNNSTKSTAEKLPTNKKDAAAKPSTAEKLALGRVLGATYKQTKEGAPLKDTLMAEIDKQAQGKLKDSPYLAAFKETVENLDGVSGKMGETRAEQNKAFQDSIKNMVKNEKVDPAILRGMMEDKDVKKDLMKDLPLTKKLSLNAKMAASKIKESFENTLPKKEPKPKLEVKEKNVKPKEEDQKKADQPKIKETPINTEEKPKPAFIQQKLQEINRKTPQQQTKQPERNMPPEPKKTIEIKSPDKKINPKDMIMLRGDNSKQTGIPKTTDVTKAPPPKPKDLTIKMPQQDARTNALRIRRILSKQAG